MARIRKGDQLFFYLERKGFFGVFQAASEVFIAESHGRYLLETLEKKLIYRIHIAPASVYSRGVQEWKALDLLPEKARDVLWSLIYRKLKGLRSCTPIFDEEAERLVSLLDSANDGAPISGAASYTFDSDEFRVVGSPDPPQSYEDEQAPMIDCIVRMRNKDAKRHAYENLLQLHLVGNAGRASVLDPILGVGGDIQWLGNEVACGVGMQKIDVLTITCSERGLTFNVVELKDEEAQSEVVWQLEKYSVWVASRFEEAHPLNIQPVLVSRRIDNPLIRNGPTAAARRRATALESLRLFNGSAVSLPVRWFEFFFDEAGLSFEEVDYESNS